VGKSSKPVRFLVHPSIANAPEFQALREQGHVIDTEPTGPVWDYDAIIGPTSWRMTARHIKYLPLTIQEARRLHYPKETT